MEMMDVKADEPHHHEFVASKLLQRAGSSSFVPWL